MQLWEKSFVKIVISLNARDHFRFEKSYRKPAKKYGKNNVFVIFEIYMSKQDMKKEVHEKKLKCQNEAKIFQGQKNHSRKKLKNFAKKLKILLIRQFQNNIFQKFSNW